MNDAASGRSASRFMYAASRTSPCLFARLDLQCAYGFAGYRALRNGEKAMVDTLWPAICGFALRQGPSTKTDRHAVVRRRRWLSLMFPCGRAEGESIWTQLRSCRSSCR